MAGHDVRAALAASAGSRTSRRARGPPATLERTGRPRASSCDDQPPLGVLDGAPVAGVVRVVQVGDRPVQAAGDASASADWPRTSSSCSRPPPRDWRRTSGASVGPAPARFPARARRSARRCGLRRAGSPAASRRPGTGCCEEQPVRRSCASVGAGMAGAALLQVRFDVIAQGLQQVLHFDSPVKPSLFYRRLRKCPPGRGATNVSTSSGLEPQLATVQVQPRSPMTKATHRIPMDGPSLASGGAGGN